MSTNAAVACTERSPQLRSSTVISQRPSGDRNNPLPREVVNAVRKDVSRRTGIPPGQLRITRHSQETWPNGCLGLAEPDQICTQALVSGWRVVVSHEGQTWVYRTNESGSVVRLDERASASPNSGTVKPVRMPASELPPPLDRGVVFRTITSGGISGRTYETVLMEDGQLMQYQVGDANDSTRRVLRVSRQQVQQFQRLLDRQPLAQFNRLSYPAPRGSADFMTVTLIAPSGTTRYADVIQNRLPQSIQDVIQAWERLTRQARAL